jgi:hypothetical protein
MRQGAKRTTITRNNQGFYGTQMSVEADLFEKSNAKLLLLTGAGASKPLGMPLMREFHDLVARRCDQPQKELLRNISLVNVREGREVNPDLEALLALVERYRGFHSILFEDDKFGYPFGDERAQFEFQGLLGERGPSHPESYLKDAYDRKGVLENLDALLRDLVFEVYGKELDNRSLETLYSPLFKVIYNHFPQKLLPIFTTNYDMAIESYAMQASSQLETGFASTHIGNIWKPSRFYQFQPTKDKQSLALFKLHGSLAWHRRGNSIVSTGLPIRDPSGYQSVVIYPTQTKEFPDEEPFRTAYNFLKGCLRVASVTIVIGYSFRDPGIQRIMTDALEVNQNLFYILICGPEKEHWKKFAQQNLRSYQIIPHYFALASNGAPYLQELDRALAEVGK